MGEEKKKCCGGFFKKLLVSVIALAALTYGGWFAYAKYSGDPKC
jgi:hypothetical protein